MVSYSHSNSYILIFSFFLSLQILVTLYSCSSLPSLFFPLPPYTILLLSSGGDAIGLSADDEEAAPSLNHLPSDVSSSTVTSAVPSIYYFLSLVFPPLILLNSLPAVLSLYIYLLFLPLYPLFP